jgi:putative ABC transport system permease protein
MWVLALKMVWADRTRMLTILVGVAFSVVLINLQGALYLGLMNKASLLVNHTQADIWVGHRHMQSVDLSVPVPERWLQRIRGLDGVERADPYVLTFGDMALRDGRHERVAVIGCNPTGLGNAWAMSAGQAAAIRQADGILIDASDAGRLGGLAVGGRCELSGKRARVVGLTTGVVSFTTSPCVFTTIERARRRYALIPVGDGYCSFFLVKARPGTDLRALMARIRERVPELDVRERDAFGGQCEWYWQAQTGIGLSFGLAAFLGLLVGLVVVAQTFYAMVSDRLKEFCTLKALGANDLRVGRFLLSQALALAGAGCGLGLAVAVVVGSVLHSPRIQVIFNRGVMVGSIALLLAICLAAALLPYWRIRRLDPAMVLRS